MQAMGCAHHCWVRLWRISWPSWSLRDVSAGLCSRLALGACNGTCQCIKDWTESHLPKGCPLLPRLLFCICSGPGGLSPTAPIPLPFPLILGMLLGKLVPPFCQVSLTHDQPSLSILFGSCLLLGHANLLSPVAHAVSYVGGWWPGGCTLQERSLCCPFAMHVGSACQRT